MDVVIESAHGDIVVLLNRGLYIQIRLGERVNQLSDDGGEREGDLDQGAFK
jgi:hypothetical protein